MNTDASCFPSEVFASELKRELWQVVKAITQSATYVDREDLVTVGFLAILKRYPRFAAGGYSVKWLIAHARWAILNELKRQSPIKQELYEKRRKLEQVQVSMEQRLGRYVSAEELAGALGISLRRLERLKFQFAYAQQSSLDHSICVGSDGDELLSEEYRAALISPCEHPSRRIEHEELKEAIKRLKPSHQEVMQLYYVEDLSITALSERLQCSRNCVSKRLWQMRQNLREMLDPVLLSTSRH